jgi:protoporphyrinogen oxidase
MFSKYFCVFNQNVQVENQRGNENDTEIKNIDELDKSYHFAYMKDGINSLMDIIEQKIQHNIVLNANELEYISNLEKEQMYKIVLCLYNKNNEKY